MKHVNTIIVFLLGLLALTACHKDKELDVKDAVVSDEEMTVSGTQARFSWSVDFAGKFQTGVEVSQNENMAEARRVEATKEEDKFVAIVDSLSMGKKYYYRIVVWNKFGDFGQSVGNFTTLEVTQDTTYYTITVGCQPEEGGVASGGGTFAEYDTCTLTAVPNEGYYFINWTFDDSVVSTEGTYSFEVTRTANYVANFELNDNDPLIYSINGDGVSVTVTGHVDGTAAMGTLTIPETKTIGGVTYTVTTIGESAFFGCTGFTGNLTIPNSVNTIGNYAFYGCSGFTGGLTFGNSVETIGVGAFFECRGFTGSLTIPNSVTTIGNYAFAWCTGLTGSLTIPNSVTTIDYSAFYGCSGFNGSLTLGNSVTTIGSNAFDGCSGFTGDLIIPNSVTTIAWKAFFGCSGFTGSLAISNSVTTIGGYAFCECSGFTGSLTIPNSVTAIGNSAFNGCSGLTGSLIIPNSVTTIGWQTFSGCSGFTGNLNIPNSIDTIGWQTFSGCSGFTGNLNIPNSVTTIGNDAFYNCSGFTGSLTIPNSVNTIDFGAFANCNGFTSIQAFANTAPIVGVDYMGRDAFYGMNHAILVTVPCGSLNSYQNATGWSEFTDIREMCQYEISTTVNPTGSGTADGGGTFQQGQSCTVTATANAGFGFINWTENGSVVSTQANYTFTVTDNRALVANFNPNGGSAPQGAINGQFTINENGDKVYFSKGNLQYIGSATTPYWKFADNQWDCLGNNGQGSDSQTVDRDLFGWGTSGWSGSGATYYRPWDTDNSNGSLYGPPGEHNLIGTYAHADWGVHNSISNTSGSWYTLTMSEWDYVFSGRGAETRFAKGCVNGVHGVILFPDSYTHPNGVAQPTGINDTGNAGWYENNYTVSDFGMMQAAGAVFLPAAGGRYGTSVSGVGGNGSYWSALYFDSTNAQFVFFGGGTLFMSYGDRYNGLSVRLVCPTR